MNAPVSPDSLHFSVTQIKTWLLCPRKFEYRYILGAEPEFTPMPLAFGVAFHSALAHHYGWLKLGDLAPREEVHQRFFDSLATTRDASPPIQSGEDGVSFEEAVAKGRLMLDVTLSHPSAIAKVLSVEQAFVVDLHHPDTGEVLEERLLGVVDRRRRSSCARRAQDGVEEVRASRTELRLAALWLRLRCFPVELGRGWSSIPSDHEDEDTCSPGRGRAARRGRRRGLSTHGGRGTSRH